MKIEDHWTDVIVYQVEIKIKRDGERTLHKLLVFGAELSQNEIKGMIKTKFNNVLEVTRLDELDDGLYMHENPVAGKIL